MSLRPSSSRGAPIPAADDGEFALGDEEEEDALIRPSSSSAAAAVAGHSARRSSSAPSPAAAAQRRLLLLKGGAVGFVVATLLFAGVYISLLSPSLSPSDRTALQFPDAVLDEASMDGQELREWVGLQSRSLSRSRARLDSLLSNASEPRPHHTSLCPGLGWSPPLDAQWPGGGEGMRGFMRGLQVGGAPDGGDLMHFHLRTSPGLRCDSVWKVPPRFWPPLNATAGRDRARELCKHQVGRPQPCTDFQSEFHRTDLHQNGGSEQPYMLSIASPAASTSQGVIQSPRDGEASWILNAQCAWKSPGYFQPSHVPLPSMRTGAQLVAKKVINLGQMWSAQYFHFLLETLPKLSLLSWETLVGQGYVIVVMKPQYPALLEVMEWFGLADRVVYIEPTQWVFAEESTLLLQPGSCGENSPILLTRFQRVLWRALSAFDTRWARERGECFDPSAMRSVPPAVPESGCAAGEEFSSTVSAPPSAGGAPSPRRCNGGLFRRIVWIERKGARGLFNSEALRRSVVSHFPHAVLTDFFGDVSLRETADVFAGADLVIGPHGAGLTNTIFTPPGAVVVELLSESYVNFLFSHYSAVWGHEHTYFVTGKDFLADAGEFDALMAHLAQQSREERILQIDEGVRRRLRFDNTCVSEVQLRFEPEWRREQDRLAALAAALAANATSASSSSSSTGSADPRHRRRSGEKRTQPPPRKTKQSTGSAKLKQNAAGKSTAAPQASETPRRPVPP